MHYLIISSSLNPNSRSRILANFLAEDIKNHTDKITMVDMRDYPLPLCDANTAYGDKNVQKLSKLIQQAHGVIICAPIYNYDVNAVVKNLIELTGRAWTHKIVGFALAAGGQGSYMSVTSIANSLMLDFRCVIIPRFVFVNDTAFSEDKVSDPEIKNRLQELSVNLVHFTKGLVPHFGLIDIKKS